MKEILILFFMFLCLIGVFLSLSFLNNESEQTQPEHSCYSGDNMEGYSDGFLVCIAGPGKEFYYIEIRYNDTVRNLDGAIIYEPRF